MATPALSYENYYSTTLAQACTLSDTTIYLNALPVGSEGFLVIEPDSSTNREVIYFTSKGVNFITLPSAAAGRGQDGTSAVAHAQGVAVQMNNVAAMWEALQDGSAIGFGGGWLPGAGTWTYASATTFTVPQADADRMSVGTKIKLTQTTTKYFYVTGVSGTTVTVTGGTDYTVANAAITAPFFSNAATPQGFPQTFAYAGPLTTNISVNKGSTGTESYTFSMAGKRVKAKGWLKPAGTGIDFGSGGSALTIPLPITISAGSAAQYTASTPLGTWYADDSGSSSWFGPIMYSSTTVAGGLSPNASGDVRLLSWTNQRPITAGAGDAYTWEFEYDV